MSPERALLPAAPLVLTVEEVGLLWSFVHGDILDTAVRGALLASWGLCPRHAWGHAVVEVELWQHGAGARGGHQPFDVVVLLDDLLESAARHLTPGTWLLHRQPRVPTPQGRCWICRQAHEVPSAGGLRLSYANSDPPSLAAEANTLTHTRGWCREAYPVWSARGCPLCAGGATASTEPGKDPFELVCRHHLETLGPISRPDADRIAMRLREIRARLGHLLSSMTANGAPATAAEDSSWIEALGWFAGWGLPRYLVTQANA